MTRLIVLFIFLMSSFAFADTRNVLLINSYSWKLPWQNQLEDGFFSEFKPYSISNNINLYIENIVELRTLMNDEEMYRYFKNKYKSMQIDLVIQDDAASVPFVTKYKNDLFQEAQFFSYINANIIQSVKDILPDGYMTPLGTEHVETIRIMLKQMPDLEKIYMISSSLDTSRILSNSVLEKVKKLDDAPEIILVDDIAYVELLKLVSKIKDKSAIYYFPFLKDNTGKRFIPINVLETLSKISNVPIYSSWETFIGKGIVGGKLLHARKVGEILAKNTIKILNGAPADTIKAKEADLTAYMFDMSQIKKWKISEKTIPENSVLINNKPSAWDQYKHYILTTVTILILQGLLIFALIIARKKSLISEEKFQESNRKLEKLLDISTDKVRTLSRAIEQSSSLVLITDTDGYIEYVNSTFEDVMGYKLEEIKGEKPKIFKSDSHDDEYYKRLWMTLKNGDDWKGEFINIKKSGDKICVLNTITPVNDEEGSPSHFVAVQTDITSRKEAEEMIQYLAYHDPLTDLPSLRLARNEIKSAIANCNRHNTKFALMYIDLDDFKKVNDSLGHDAGDELLKQAAQRIRNMMRDTDTAARIGGDEFLIIQTDVKDDNSISVFATKIIEYVSQPYDVFGNEAQIGLSMGVAVYPTTALSQDELLKFSDNAMYESKQRGKNQYTIYNNQK